MTVLLLLLLLRDTHMRDPDKMRIRLIMFRQSSVVVFRFTRSSLTYRSASFTVSSACEFVSLLICHAVRALVSLIDSACDPQNPRQTYRMACRQSCSAVLLLIHVQADNEDSLICDNKRPQFT